jgi:hypothetical protein
MLYTFEWVEERLMDQIPGLIMALSVYVLVAIVATIAQRTWGSKSLFWVWIASAVTITGAILFWSFYQHGFPLPSTRQQLFALAIVSVFLFMVAAFASALAIWFAAVFGPRPPQDSSTEVNYFPFNMPLGKLEETDGLAGILRRYQELLAIFATALDSALDSTPFHPYLPLWRALPRIFRSYLPGFTRQARASSRQFEQAPNALMRDLAGADVVLAELETLTPAQLSAIEECHRVNVKRLGQRSFLSWNWRSGVAVSVAAIGSLAIAAEKVAGVKPSDLWALMSGITLTGITLQSNILILLYGSVMLMLGVILNIMTFRPALRRVQAFEDILTIAKAYRKGSSEAIKPPAELSLTVTD